MCLIAYQPAGKEAFPRRMFKHAWSANRDGAGYMFSANGVLTIRKPFYRKRDLMKAYRADHAAYGASSPFVLHFRYSTHGDKGTINVHPHSLAKGAVGLVHNGILDEFEPHWKATISDTVHFCTTVLAMRESSQLMSVEFGEFLEKTIGSCNKFVLMDHAGNVRLINEDVGVWDDGCWYSNHGYKAAPPVATTPLQMLATRAVVDFTSWAGSRDVAWDEETPNRYFDGTASEDEYQAYCAHYECDPERLLLDMEWDAVQEAKLHERIA